MKGTQKIVKEVAHQLERMRKQKAKDLNIYIMIKRKERLLKV